MDRLFSRFVEAGRLARVAYGPHVGKYVVIVDMLNTKRVLVDGPTSGVPRQVMPTRWLSPTDLTLPLQRGSRTGTVVKAMKKKDIVSEAIKSTPEGKRSTMQKKIKESTDFQRFKLRVARAKLRAAAAK